LENDTTLLFELPGVRVDRVERSGDGSRVVHASTVDSSMAGCPACGVASVVGDGVLLTLVVTSRNDQSQL
jgi:hypothetical protein